MAQQILNRDFNSIQEFRRWLDREASDEEVAACCEPSVVPQPVWRGAAQAQRDKRARKPNWVMVWAAIAATATAAGVLLQLII